MTIEPVKQLYEATPFRPFTLHLADGRGILVRHREFMAAAPSGRTIIVYQPDDSFNIIDLLLVTDIEVGNGKRSKLRGSWLGSVCRCRTDRPMSSAGGHKGIIPPQPVPGSQGEPGRTVRLRPDWTAGRSHARRACPAMPRRWSRGCK